MKTYEILYKHRNGRDSQHCHTCENCGCISDDEEHSEAY